MDTSIQCDRDEHAECNGTALIFDTPDGPNRYVCACYCHNTKCNERKCPSCKGTGYLHEVRYNGRYSTKPGRLSQPVTPEELGPILDECAGDGALYGDFEGTFPQDYVGQARELLARFYVVRKP